ncbi:MAG: DNA-3-methyladenine glycosylase, partial [Chloroflexi bacterium]|nr:DNA-3-methyladenine glycosylase [Chloroflexota bacterium]
IHHCLNIVTEDEGFPAAVLIRAGAPGAKGPGLVCRELGLTREQNGFDVTSSALHVEQGEPADAVVETQRIGVDYAGEWALKPWRFYIEGNPWVSRKAKLRAPSRL